MYYSGQGVPKDIELAFKWYRKSAEQGNADAQNKLGVMYEKGQGILKDDKEAVKWFRKSAKQGNTEASKYLKITLRRQKRKSILENLISKAKGGDSNSQFKLGEMYFNGRGVKRNPVESLKWYTLAARQGNIRADELIDVVQEVIEKEKKSSEK